MRRLLFAAVICGTIAADARAQAVPARDLLEFPLGAIGEAPALAMQLSSGLWNPAAISLRSPDRVQLGVVALNSPIDQGITSLLVAAAFKLPWNLLGTASVVQANVNNIARTATDPQDVGEDVPYGTTLVSVGVARRFGNVTLGVAARYRSGTEDYIQSSAPSFDGGIVVDRVLGTPLRFAASTFLLSPTRGHEAATLMGALDTPLLTRRDSVFEIRGGVSESSTQFRGDERYLFTAWRYGNVEARGGIARVDEFGSVSDHLRLGLGVHYAGYSIGIAREDQGAGLGAIYQFMLTSTYR